MGLVTPGLGLLFWMSLSFILVLLILRFTAWKPILAALKERENTIQDSLDAAKKAKDDIAKMQADNEAAIRKAHEERERILKEAKELGDRYIADAKRAATAEGEKAKAEAREAIQAEKAAALKEIKSSVAEISVIIAEKLLRAELSDASKQQQLVDEMFKDVNLN